MIQNKKRIISLILMLTLLVSALVVGAVTASAADTSITVTGASGSLASDSESISWTDGGFSVVNYKNTSSTAIRTSDSDHFRLYVGNKFTISGGAMSKVVIETVSSYLITNASNTVSDGWTVSADGTTITYTATSGSENELSISIGKQSRIKNVVITPATSSEPVVPEPEVPAPEIGNEATISFADTTHRVSQDTQSQVWANGEFIVTNNKGSSSSNVANYSNPVRFYKGSEIIISFPGMTSLVIEAPSGDYGTPWGTTLTGAGLSYTNEGTVYTVTFANPTDSVTLTASAQVRANSITASAAVADTPTCEHINTTEEKVEATCTKDGSITVTCDECGVITSTTTIDALGHSYNEGDITTDPTCTEQGEMTYTCSACSGTKKEKINATGHTYVDGICSVCGEKEINYSGRYVIAVNRGAGANYFYMTSDLGTASTKRYQAVDSGLTELPTTVCLGSEYIFVFVKNEDGTYKIYADGVDSDNYLGWTSGNSGTLVDAESALNFSVVKRDDGTYNISFDDRYLSLNGTSGNNYFAYYTGTQKQNLSLVPVSDGHIYNTVVTDPTFDEQGYTTYTCACGHSYIDDYVSALIAVATADGDKYTSLAEALENGSEIVLLADVNLEATIVITGSSSYTFNLNGHTITAGFSSEIVEAFLVKDGGTLVIFGNGQILANGDGEHVECISAIDGGKVTIENGTFISDGCTAIYATRGGSVTIKGGYYEAKELYNGMNFLIDINEAEEVKGVITISGGTFVKFNPANHSNDGKDYTNKVVEGYVVKAVSDIYTVVELDDISGEAIVGDTYYETLEQAIAGATAGTTIKLNANVKVTGDVVVTNNVIIDLNGKELEVSGDLITFHSTTRIIGDGKLVIDKDGLLDMTGTTEYVPVWHTEGYYTFEQIKSQVKDGGEAGNETVIFRPAFIDGSHADIFGDVDEDYVEGESTEYNGGAANNGISFVVSITWEGLAEPKEYTLSNTLIAEIYSQKKAIQLGFENWQADVEYTVTLRIVSGGLYYETKLCTMLNGDVAPNVPTSVTE